MSQYRNIQLMTGLPFNVKPIIDITDQLPSRSPDPETPRTPDKITYISVHHSGVEGGSPQSYADYHVNTRKWYHIGYHTVVEGNQIYQTNDLMTFSYHTSSNNHYTVSVSVSGDFTKRDLTESERNCLYAVILTFMDMFKIPVENVLGHREYPGNETTDCPGFSMDKVREDIRHYWNVMQSKDTWATKLTKVGELANQYQYMFDRIKLGEANGDAQWGMNQLLAVRDIMKSQGLL